MLFHPRRRSCINHLSKMTQPATYKFPTYEFTYKLYRWGGLACHDFESPTKKFLYRIYDVFLTVSYLFFNSLYAYEVMANANKLPLKEIMFHLVSFLICLGIVVKRLLVLGKKNRVKALYLRLKKDFENPLITNIKEADAIIKKFDNSYKTKILSVYTYGCLTVLLFFLPAVIYFPTYFPFPIPFHDYLNFTEITFIIVWESVLIWIGFLNYLAYDSLVWGFLMLICTRLQLLRKLWETFTDEYPSIDFTKYISDYEGYPIRNGEGNVKNRNYYSYDEYMRHDNNVIKDTVQLVKDTVDYYQEIMEEIETVERLYSFPQLIQMVGGAFLVAFIIVFLIAGEFNDWEEFRTFAIFGDAVADMFIFSYYGSKLDESKTALAHAIYSSPWYEGDVLTGKLMLHTMQMMKNKMEFTAGGFITINLESFLSLMKLSYNCLALFK